jgi:hypothetical protein
MAFEKGKSGNPTGRPKENAEIKALALEKAPMAFQKILDLMDGDDPKISMAAAQEVLNRALGKPAQAMEVSGKGGTKLAAIFEIVRKEK